jgi:hypothetical protein
MSVAAALAAAGTAAAAAAALLDAKHLAPALGLALYPPLHQCPLPPQPPCLPASFLPSQPAAAAVAPVAALLCSAAAVAAADDVGPPAPTSLPSVECDERMMCLGAPEHAQQPVQR